MLSLVETRLEVQSLTQFLSPTTREDSEGLQDTLLSPGFYCSLQNRPINPDEDLGQVKVTLFRKAADREDRWTGVTKNHPA